MIVPAKLYRMALVDNLTVFLVSLLVGAFGIYVGGHVVTDRDDYTYAIVTALLGAIVWVVVATLVGWIPLLGPLLALLAYIALINYRYPGGWTRALLIAVVAWLVVLAVLYALAVFEITSFGAVGVPGI